MALFQLIFLCLSLRFIVLYVYERWANMRAPLVGLFIPWLGCAPFYLIAPLHLLKYCKYTCGEAFTLYIAGRYINVRLSAGFERYFYHAPESQLSFVAAAQDFFGPTLGRNAFDPNQVKAFSKLRHKLLGNPIIHAGKMSEVVDDFLDDLIQQLGEKRLIFIHEHLPRLVSKINVSCLVGKELGEDDSLVSNFKIVEDGINSTSSLPPFLTSILLVPAKVAFTSFQKSVLKALHDRNSTTATKNSTANDLLSLIQTIHSPDEEAVIAARIFSVLYAGGTTGKMVAQVMTLLFQHPTALQKVREEIFYGSDKSDKIDLNNLLKNTPYFSLCIEEALRLKTGILSIRKATSLITWENYRIYPGELVSISPYYSHHVKQNFREPQVFFPERNCSEKNGRITTGRNHGWGGGRHVCAGRLFAIYSAKIIISKFFQRFKGLQLHNGSRGRGGDDFAVPGIALCKPRLVFQQAK